MIRKFAALCFVMPCLPVLMMPAPARAMGSCSGQYSATPLQPLPQPVVVALVLSDNSPRNVQLAQDFSNGLGQAGIAVGNPPNVNLSVTYQIYGQGGNSGGGGGDGGGTGWGTANSWDAMQGGVTLQQPDMPNFDAFSPSAPVQSAELMARFEARDTQTNKTDWVAVVQCTVQDGGQQTLVYDLGYLIGGALGKRVNQGRM